MKTNHTFSIAAIVRRTKANNKGEVPIYIRIIVNGQRAEIATKHFLKPDQWDIVNGKAKGTGKLIRAINETIDLFKVKAKQQYNRLVEAGKELSVESIKNGVLGVEEKQPSLLEVFQHMVTDVKAKVGVNYSNSCYCAYLASLNHIRIFLESKFGKSDIKLKDLNYSFISDYEVYLKTTGKCRQNGAIKHIQRLKMAVKIAMKHEYLDKDPFIKYSISKEKVIRKPLNQSELNTILQKDLAVDRLAIIKDMFLFTCYTGLSFIDAKSLRAGHIGKGVDGHLWIFIDRKKTGNPCNIPLFPAAVSIINKYKDHPKVVETGYLLPIPSNQKFNAYLKEIADLCGIMKKLTVHIGRHTFATTIALENGVPIEVVKEMLGHDKLETTEIYAKVSVMQIASSVQNLRKKLSL